jgi:hypothetical protein
MKNLFPSLRRTRRVLLALTAIAACGGGLAYSDDDSRVVVVAPKPGQTPVPIAPDEKVGNATAVTPPGGAPLVVVRVDKMPAKPDFNIITPDGVSHPYKNGDSGIDGMTVVHEPQVVQDATGKTWYRVVSCYTKNGRQVACGRVDYPVGSQLVADPPQPPGLVFLCPDAVPSDPTEEALVLDALGMADTVETQVWRIPSGEMHLMHDASPSPTTLVFGLESAPPAEPPSSEPGSQEPTEPKEIEPTGVETPSVPLDPPGSTEAPGEIATTGPGVDNDDSEIVFTSVDGAASDEVESSSDPSGADADQETTPSSDPQTSSRDSADESAAANEMLSDPFDPCGFGVLTALPLCVLSLGASRRALRRRGG